MTDEEYRQDLLASAASRADTRGMGSREAFVDEVTERLRDAGELSDVELCAERIEGFRGRRLELDAFAFDDADESLHLIGAIRGGAAGPLETINLTDARNEGFNRLTGIFEQSRSGWIATNVEESRPLWALARMIETRRLPSALRLHVLTDRIISDRLRAIPGETTKEGVPVRFQIWDISRLKRIHEALNVRDDLVVDLSDLPGGGLPVLPAAMGDDYQAYLAVMPGAALADIYIRHGSRLLEGNVRTFLGRRGNINKGISTTLSKEPSRFFAYNNGIAATASAVQVNTGDDGKMRVTSITDLQIVNGAQTTASLAALRREQKLPDTGVFVPMKLSVVTSETAEILVPAISRYSNSQNAVRASDFFANHDFHRRIEQVSRRILAPAADGSQIQTHWYYERSRGQYLNDQTGFSNAKRDQFVRLNPRKQLITKTDLAKVETCFDLLPDTACRGAEKAFIAFAIRVTDEWKDERRRSQFSDDWFRSAAARVIIFRATESLVSTADWYASGTRAQVVAHTTARLALLAQDISDGGHLDYLRVWGTQAVDELLQAQLLVIAERVMAVLLSPPVAGQAVGEWAKQQACRKRMFETSVPVIAGFENYVVAKADASVDKREQRAQQRVTEGLSTLTEAVTLGPAYWERVRRFAQAKSYLTPAESVAISIAVSMPGKLPTDAQAGRLMVVRNRCQEAGFAP